MADATTPTLTSVTTVHGYPRATFVAPDADGATIYFSDSAERATDGRFLEPHLVGSDTLTAGEIANGYWTSSSQLGPGHYWTVLNADGWPDDGDYFSEWSNVLELDVPKPPPSPLPTLRIRTARRYVRAALERRFRGAWSFGYAHRVRGCERRSRLRVRCVRVSWVVGDLNYRGLVTVWTRRRGDGTPTWRYGYRIRQLDEYCAATGGQRCARIYRTPRAR